MSNSLALAQKPERFANRVKDELTASKRTRRWLSDETGIPYSTLNRHLDTDPQNFKLGEVTDIIATLGFDALEMAS